MNATNPVVNFKDKLLSDFQLFEQSLNGSSTLPIHAIRRKAIQHFDQLGFPTPRHEEWKYTNMAAVLRQPFRTQMGPPAIDLSADDFRPFLIDDLDAHVLVFVNGWFRSELSTSADEEAELCIGSFAEAQKGFAPAFDQHFAQHAAYTDDAFTALSTAFARDGLFLNVSAGRRVSRPIHLLMINDAREADYFVQPRHLLLLDANARATVIESTHTLGAGRSFSNIVSEVVLGEGAQLDYYKVQNDSPLASSIATIQAHQHANSLLRSFTLSLGGAMLRNNVNATLAGKAAHTDLFGLTMLKGREFVDNHTLVDHAVPHCTSNELYKGIYDERSQGVFNGKILVRPDAQRTNAFQSNHNILLSDGATINTKPQLEIFADDVKCSHGATSGQLDENALFYLRSRGLSLEAARAILVHAFAVEILNTIEVEELRTKLDAQITERLSFTF